MNHYILLYLYACWHVLLPGHGKTLLVAVCVSGGTRRNLFHLGLGYGLSHGLLMSAAAFSGLYLFQRLLLENQLVNTLARNAYLPILLVIGCYFGIKAILMAKRPPTEEHPDKDPETSQVQRHPFLTGLGVGFIPCSDVLGLAVISPMLLSTHDHLVPAAIIVWLGVLSMVMLIATILRYMPVHRFSRRTPPWLPYAGASLICLCALLYKGWMLWKDYMLLYH